jgi:hypothetical protein
LVLFAEYGESGRRKREEDGIRTRDPHLGKVLELVFLMRPSSVKCFSVHPVSTPSTQSVAVVERSTTGCAVISQTGQGVAARRMRTRGQRTSAVAFDASERYRRHYGLGRQISADLDGLWPVPERILGDAILASTRCTNGALFHSAHL